MYIMESNACQSKYGKICLVQSFKQLKLQADNNGLFYFSVQFVSTDDIVVIQDAQNIFLRSIVGITSFKRS